jgi:hypothetical protein
MDIDPEKQKKVITWFITQIKNLELEILACRAVFIFADHVLHIGPELKQALTQARESPSIHAIVDKKYDSVLETLLSTIDQAQMEQSLAEWLRDWKPEGSPN